MVVVRPRVKKSAFRAPQQKCVDWRARKAVACTVLYGRAGEGA
jgi:hypothetical protein